MQDQVHLDEEGVVKKSLKSYSITQLELLAGILKLKPFKNNRFQSKPKEANLPKIIKKVMIDYQASLIRCILPTRMNAAEALQRMSIIAEFCESTPFLTDKKRLLANRQYAERWIETDVAKYKLETKESFTPACERINRICEQRLESIRKELDSLERTHAATTAALQRFSLGDDNSYRIPDMSNYCIRHFGTGGTFGSDSISGVMERYAATPVSVVEEVLPNPIVEELDEDDEQPNGPPPKKRRLK